MVFDTGAEEAGGMDMELLEILKHRRSVREYTGEPIPKEQLEKILAAGLLSPSGRSRKPWELVIVQNRNMLKELVKCREGAANMLEKAGCAILVFADPEKTDVWTEDCSIVMSNMHLMADSLGLGSCWIQGRLRKAQNGMTTEEFCRQLLQVPKRYQLEAILSVGVTEKHPDPRSLEEAELNKVHNEAWEK